MLQELLSAVDLSEVTYKVATTGPDHQKRFSAQTLVEGENWGEGQESSKEIAEYQAAETTVATLAQRCPEVVGSEIRQDLFPGRDPDA